jgi:hypothetical protein
VLIGQGLRAGGTGRVAGPTPRTGTIRTHNRYSRHGFSGLSG